MLDSVLTRVFFKVEFLWVPTTESAQIFLPGSMCVSSKWVTTCHVPHVHMGMCTCRFMKAHAKTCSEELNLAFTPTFSISPYFFIRWTLALRSLYVRRGGIFSKLLIKEQAIIVWFTIYKSLFQNWISLGSDDRIGSNFFPGSVCVSSTWVSTCHVPHVHVDTCTCRFMKAHAQKSKKPNFLNFCHRKKLNTKIWGRRKF